MTKNELAYKIGSQNIWRAIKSFFVKWFFFTLVFLSFIGGVNVFNLANSLKNDAIPKLRKLISEREMRSEKVLSKNHSIKIIKKIENQSPFFLIYKIESNDIKSKKGTSFFYISVPEVFEELFLQEAKSKSLKLEYNEGLPEHPILAYPAISEVKKVLDELDEDTFSLYITSTRFLILRIFNGENSQNETPEEL